MSKSRKEWNSELMRRYLLAGLSQKTNDDKGEPAAAKEVAAFYFGWVGSILSFSNENVSN